VQLYPRLGVGLRAVLKQCRSDVHEVLLGGDVKRRVAVLNKPTHQILLLDKRLLVQTRQCSESANLRQGVSPQPNWSGIRIWINPASDPDVCRITCRGFVILSASVISLSVMKIGRWLS